MRDGEGLKFFLTDHLGSVVAVTDADGERLEQQRYLPFGEVRSDLGPVTQTDFGYTFQRALDQQGNGFSLGLMDYKARFYSSALGRFTQPDTDVPARQGPQGLNRYAYVNNNPLRFVDPTGHSAAYCNFSYSSSGSAACQAGTMTIQERLKQYGVTLGTGFENATYTQVYDLYIAALFTGTALMRAANGHGNTAGVPGTFSSATDALQSVMGQVTINIGNGPTKGNCETVGGTITCNSMPDIQTTVHELGHVFDYRYQEINGRLVSGLVHELMFATGKGYICDSMPCVAHSIKMDNFDPLTATSEEIAERRMEDFADMFMNWVLPQYPGFSNNGFNLSVNEGELRTWFMTGRGWYPHYGMRNFMADMGFGNRSE